MAWLYVPELAGSSSDCNSGSGARTAPSATSNATPPQCECSGPGSETADYTTRPFTGTCSPSTEHPGAVQWISSLLASRASRSARPAGAGGSPRISGPRCSGLRSNAELLSSSAKTFTGPRSNGPAETWLEPAFVPAIRELPPPAWVPRTAGCDGGYLPTLTTRLNQFSDSMQKWPAYRRLRALAGRRAPVAFWEWMMGFPIGWTA